MVAGTSARESVKEMKERNSSFYCCQMCNTAQIHYFLYRSRYQHSEACLSARHYV